MDYTACPASSGSGTTCHAQLRYDHGLHGDGSTVVLQYIKHGTGVQVVLTRLAGWNRLMTGFGRSTAERSQAAEANSRNTHTHRAEYASDVDSCISTIMSAWKPEHNQCISVRPHTQPKNRKPSLSLRSLYFSVRGVMAGIQPAMSLTLAAKYFPIVRSGTTWAHHTRSHVNSRS